MGDLVLASKAFERNTISCALNNQELLEMLDLPVAAFESDELRIVYSMIHDLKATGHQQINIDTLRMFYDSRQDFYSVIKEHGGYKFLEALSSRPDFSNFHFHLEELRQRYEIRIARARAAEALSHIEGGSFSTRSQIFDVLDGIMDNTRGIDPEMDIFHGLTLEWLDEQSGKFERGEFKTPGIPITDSSMRDAFGPYWYVGSLNIWAAETGIGKSQAVGMLVRQGFEDGIPSLVLDNEMTAPEFRNRNISAAAMIPMGELVTGRAYNPRSEYYKDLRKHITKTASKQHLVEWRKVIEMKMERIEPLIRRFMRRYPVAEYPYKQVIVDGIKMTNEGDNLFQVGYFAQKLKEFAGRFSNEGLVIHATCQLQRPAKQTIKDKASNPSDHNQIGLSKLISDNATVVAIMTKEPLPDFSGWDANKRRIYVPKHRFHATLEANCYLSVEFDGKCSFMNPLMVILPHGPARGGAAPEGTPTGARIVRLGPPADHGEDF